MPQDALGDGSGCCNTRPEASRGRDQAQSLRTWFRGVLGLWSARPEAYKLVYILVADKRLQYEDGKSRIAYIGTTAQGVSRIASSVAKRAESILEIPGVLTFTARVVTCQPRRIVKTWHKLERALLLGFRDKFGDAPWCNTHGKKMKETDEFRYFTRIAIRNVIEELS